MANTPSPSDATDQSPEPPTPEVLKPQDEEESVSKEAEATAQSQKPQTPNRLRRVSYRPSHKATFVGLAVVAAILLINAAIIFFVLKGQAKPKSSEANQAAISLSPGVLDKLGVSRNSVGTAGQELVVAPDSRFGGKVSISGDVSVGGQLKINSKFTATDASLAQLEAGNTSLGQLNVSGDGTVSSLNLRKDLVVQGLARLQGAVTVSQVFTVNNNVNISGNLAVGGVLSVVSFHASSLVSDSTLTIGGHIITRGSAPGVGPGPALGANGTVSISGNDAAGTVAANIGTGASSGIVANIAFRAAYSTTPHVVVTPVGSGVDNVYITRSIGGFSIGVNGPLAPGGYAFDYIVEQ
jgi:hypothetical protein